MKSWTNRPKEEAHLLNPSFCCVVLASSVNGYASIEGSGMPYPLSFMILPLVLHRATRELLPKTISTSMAAWLQENASARVLFFEHLVSLKPYTNEAIQFGMVQDWIELEAGGLIRTVRTDKEIENAQRKLSEEPRECAKRAHYVGRWFARAGSPKTTMALWGIRP